MLVTDKILNAKYKYEVPLKVSTFGSIYQAPRQLSFRTHILHAIYFCLDSSEENSFSFLHDFKKYMLI